MLAHRVGHAAAVRETFNDMPLMLLGLDGPEHRIVAANAMYRAVTGRPNLVGRTVSEAFPEVRGQQLVELFDRVYASGVAETAREWRVRFRRDGSAAPEELYFDFAAAPRRAPGGAVTGINAYALPVTDRVMERREAQAREEAAERRYEHARELIATLQRELLPADLPVLPGVHLAASYLLAEAETAAGGDWFDAVPLPDGRVALIVGDVVGHGVAASVTMGQFRAVLRDHLDSGGDLLEALAAADRMARRAKGAHAATVCLAALDPRSGVLTYCTAGHPPPLLVAASGPPRYLPPTGGGPLGTGSAYVLRTDRLEVGEVALLYSDGIIERPGREPAAAAAELATTAADAVAGRAFGRSGLSAVDRACTHPLELLVRATGYADDITLLAAQRVSPPAPLRLDLPAALPALRDARTALDRWLGAAGVGEQDLNAVRHASGELVTNAAEHSLPDGSGGGLLRVYAEHCGDGTVQISVADAGRWRQPAATGSPLRERGRGLAMAAGLIDELHVDRSGSGTTATIRHRLSRPARLLTPDRLGEWTAHRWNPGSPALLLILDQPGGRYPRIRIDGPVDAITGPRLRTELQRATRGGTRALTIDLTGVTHLASAGVSVLYEAGVRNRRHGEPLLVYAPAGSSAQNVLRLVALDHTTTDPDLP
jgi:serine phosphatase RsbU (regulator of sigma subunit)/anti-sigma regulatory factor (Ser/Thr protein kinase)/anti-anti-sigma regulatory factor